MDPNKLKALKVAELKDILSTASVSFPAKINKQDLIQRILASPVAIDVYNKKQQPPTHDDLLAPPVVVDWTADEPSTLEPSQSASAAQPVVVPEPVKKPASRVKPTKPTAPAPPLTQSVATTTTPSAEVDELEKRKLRAARFGIPLIETPTRVPLVLRKNTPSTRVLDTSSPANVDDPEKLKSRAARFNLNKQTTATTTPSKRLADEDVDEEEREKRKKRQERFGGVVKI